MARERNSSGDIVTTGGSGFGIMAMIVAMKEDLFPGQMALPGLIKSLGFWKPVTVFMVSGPTG